MSNHSDDDMYIPPGQGAGGHERDDPIHYRASRNPSRRSFYDNPYSDYPYDPRPPRNPYPYAPFRDYPIEYPRYPYRSPPPRIIYLKDHPNSSRHANKDMPGRKTMKRKSSDLLESIHQLIKKSKNTPGPSGVRPGAPRAPASSTGSISRSDSRIDSDDNQGSEEGELLSDTYTDTEPESDGTEHSDIEPPVGTQNSPAPSAAALRKKLHNYIQKAREEGEDEMNIVVEELIKRERKQARLENLLSVNRPG